MDYDMSEVLPEWRGNIERIYSSGGGYSESGGSWDTRLRTNVRRSSRSVWEYGPQGRLLFRPPTSYYREVTDCHFYPLITGKADYEMYGFSDHYDRWPHTSISAYNDWLRDAKAKADALGEVAYNKALSMVLGENASLAQSFAERDEAINMFSRHIKSVAKAVTSARRRDWRGVKKALGLNWRRTPNAWLEYQYGVKPLVDEVLAVTEKLALAGSDEWLYYLATGKKALTEQYIQQYDQPNWLGEYGGILRTTVRGEIGAFARIDATADDVPYRTPYELGISNPFSIAWDLIPFSFFIDGVYPIGDWLEQLDFSRYYSIKGASISTRVKVESFSEFIPYIGSGSYMNYPVPQGRAFILERLVTAREFGFPPQFKRPSVGLVANALAILSTAMKPSSAGNTADWDLGWRFGKWNKLG